MVAKGGHRLLKEDAVNSLKSFIKNTNPVLTPNIPEAEILTGMKINNLAKQLIRLSGLTPEKDIKIEDIHIPQTSLEDVFLDLTGRKIND